MPLVSITHVTADPSPALFEDQVEFDITVEGGGPTPTGNVILHDDLGSFPDQTLVLDPDGFASYLTNSLAVGTHSVLASYQGDGTYGPSNAAVVEEVSQNTSPNSTLFGFALIASAI
jgi:hypothetical protein